VQDAEPSHPHAQHSMPAHHHAQEATANAAAGTHQGFLVSASLDSSLCLWSSAGALVGVFGRHSWTLEDTSSWQSSTRAPLKVRADRLNGCGACADVRAARVMYYAAIVLLAPPCCIMCSANVLWRLVLEDRAHACCHCTGQLTT
jgi:hypothetical protein